LRTTIERLVVRPILRADVAKAAFRAHAPELMDALVLHLLLTENKQPDEPTPRTARWAEAAKRAGQEAAARWESLTGPVAASRAPRVVESLVRFYAAGIQDPADLIDRERKFVSAARATLIGAGDDPLAEIINDPAMPRDLKLVDVLGGAVIFFQVEEGQKRPAAVVRGAFTPAGYRMVKQRLEQMQKAQDVEEDAWILGKERKAKDAKGHRANQDGLLHSVPGRLEGVPVDPGGARAGQLGAGPHALQEARARKALRDHLAKPG
jgi:type VI protein secretion system component VasK